MCVYEYAGLSLYAAGDMLHFLFRDRYVRWAAARGMCVCGGRQIDFYQIMFILQMVYKAYTLQKYSNKT